MAGRMSTRWGWHTTILRYNDWGLRQMGQNVDKEGWCNRGRRTNLSSCRCEHLGPASVHGATALPFFHVPGPNVTYV